MFVSFLYKYARRGLEYQFRKEGYYQKVRVLSHIRKGCGFHTTSPRNALPPVLVFLLRYVIKIGAIVSGRTIKKWWSKLSPEEKAKIWEKIHSKKSKIACGATIAAGGLLLYYIEHIVEDPITKRKKFMILNQKQIAQIGDFEYQRLMLAYKSFVIPPSHPIHRRVARVTNVLILSNTDLNQMKDKVWSVTVIDKPEVTNAFVLPNGNIFVFSGMLNVCTNDDQLAIVLAHEIAHCILSHVAENMSRVVFIDFLLLIPTVFFWILLPDVWAVLSDWITSVITRILFHLPFNRGIEKEADEVGLHLAAKSCYDVREAPVFWGKMKYVSQDAPVEWLSTHPSHETRQMDLLQLLPQALLVREANKCPPLRFAPRPVSYW